MDKLNNVLIIDDDKHIRNACSQILIKDNYDVTEAEDGLKGLELLKEKIYNIVILDLKMPGISGMSVLLRKKDQKFS